MPVTRVQSMGLIIFLPSRGREAHLWRDGGLDIHPSSKGLILLGQLVNWSFLNSPVPQMSAVESFSVCIMITDVS